MTDEEVNNEQTNNKEALLLNRLHELHIQLQDLLAGYVDNMLDEQEKALIEAHMAGCEACRMDVSRQQLLSQRLNELPVTRMSSQLHQRLDQVLTESPAPAGRAESVRRYWHKISRFEWLQKIYNPALITASGWGVAMMLLSVLLLPGLKSVSSNDVPMVQEVLAEYRHFSATTLPVSDQVVTQSPPVTWPDSRVLAQWKTSIGGSPAEGFAVRNGDKIVFQFRISEAVFFHNPDVRLAVANTGNYQIKSRDLNVLALPLKEAGLLIVAPTTGCLHPKN